MKLFFYVERFVGCAVLLLGCLAPLVPHQKQLNEDSWTLENLHFEGLASHDGPWASSGCPIPLAFNGSNYICENGVVKRVEHPYYLQNCRAVWNGKGASMECWQVPLVQP